MGAADGHEPARLRHDRAGAAESRFMLASVLARFTEGFDTADPLAAKALLADG